MVLLAVAVAGVIAGSDRGKKMPPCIGDLSPCLPVITDPSSAKLHPGSDCCVAVKNALRREKECFCSLFNTTSSPSSFFSFLGSTFPIDTMSRTPANIPGVCGISAADLGKCDDDGPTFPTSSQSPVVEACASSPRLINRAESTSPTSSSTPSSQASSSPPSGSGSKSSAGRLKGAVKPWMVPLMFLFMTSLIFVPFMGY
ncbi:unnamed protein product [Victoria cruziana]